MSTARTEILACLKKSCTGSARALEPTLIPKRGQAVGPVRTQMFIDEAEYGLAQVVRLSSLDAVPTEVAKHMGSAQSIKAAPHADLQNLDWADLPVKFGAGEADDYMGVSVAYAGVAETGTLVMRSGPDAPTTLNFLPDVHVVVLQESDIHGNYETVWQTLLKLDGGLGRTVNWITGPSRTADIEQTMLLGAHGPRKLVILLIHEKK